MVCLTEQIDSLESLKYAHCRAAYDLSQDTASHVLESSALVVRAEVEVFERIAQKGWDSSGGLDDLIAISPDPFTMNHGPSESGNGPLFSILPTESILPNPRGSLSRVADGHGAENERKPQSIAEGLMSDGHTGYQDDEDSQSILSDGFRSPCITQNQGVLVPESASCAGWGLDDDMSGSDTEQCSKSATRSMNRLVASGSTSLWDPGVELEGPMPAR